MAAKQQKFSHSLLFNLSMFSFQIIGGVVLGFSIWLRLDFWINQYVGASDELQKYTIGVYIFIATGSLIILFGIVGVYGAARPDKWALVAVSSTPTRKISPGFVESFSVLSKLPFQG